MDTMYFTTSNGELCHWGIKGMKWGVRRYQNKDGSLTPAGKKRYDDDDASEASGKSSSKGGSGSHPAGKKRIEDMTDEELTQAITRARMEDAYRQLRPEPKPQPSMMKRIVNEVIVPATMNSGKKALENAITKVTDKVLNGKPDPNSIDALEKLAKKLELQNKIRIAKEGKSDKDYTPEERRKQWDLDQEKKRVAKEEAEAAAKAEADKQAKKVKAAMDEYDEFQRKYAEEQSHASGNYRYRNAKNSKSNNSDKDTDGRSAHSDDVKGLDPGVEVIGEGKSRADRFTNKDYYRYTEPIHDVKYTDVPDETRDTGRTASDPYLDWSVTYLLEGPNKK